MLYSFFPEFLNMSLTASAVIMIIVLLRPLLRRVPRAISLLLWGTALFRLICPISFSADFSLLRGASTVDNRIQYLPTAYIEDTLQLSETQPSHVIAETVTQAASGSLGRTDLAHTLLIIGVWGWIVGIIIFLLINIISMYRLQKRCVGAVRTNGNVYLADRIDTPFVLGIFRPRIYVPSGLTETQKNFILQHEQTHIARLDPLWKLIAFTALALHWFNPIVWLAFHLFVRDMETACDERVLRTLNVNERADYAETLLLISVGKRTLSVSPAFGEDSPKTRIKRILQYKKPITVISVIAAAAAIILAVLLLANPKTEIGLAGDVIPELGNGEYEYYGVSICYDPERDEEYGDSAYGDYARGEELAQGILYFLENMQVETTPVSKSRAETRDHSHAITLAEKDEGAAEMVVYFSSDFSEVWVDNRVKPSYTYTVTDPEFVRQLFTFLHVGRYIGKSEDALLNAVFEAHHVSATEQYATVIYCPPMNQNSGSIKIGNVHASYITDYLHWANWTQILPVKDRLPSPESVEFVLKDDYRIQIWKNPRRAVIREGENETWFSTGLNSYSDAVDLVTKYSLSPEELEALASTDTDTPASPTTEPTAVPTVKPTMSPTPEPTATPEPTPSLETDIEVKTGIETEAATETEYNPEPVQPTMSPTPEPTPTPEPETVEAETEAEIG